MEQVEVEITGLVITARYGTLSSGDRLRTNSEFARHLVEDCSAAKYRANSVLSEQAAEVNSEPKAIRQPRKAKQ